MTGQSRRATFAGGCFWCLQPVFDQTKGVLSTAVGYTGGKTENPTYEEVCSGKTGHAEAIEVVFDPAIVAYEKLLDIFWRQIDPTTLNRQFADGGAQYRTAVYCHDEEQKKLALESKENLAKSGRFSDPIVTEIAPAARFYPAEERHQKHYLKRTLHYKLYRAASGRDRYIEKTWGA